MSDTIKDKTFFIEVAVKIEVTGAESFPDEQAVSFLDKIKTKIHCNRESMALVGAKIDVYEVFDEED